MAQQFKSKINPFTGKLQLIPGDTKSLTFTLDTPTATDVFPMFQIPYQITINKIWATAKGGTSITFNVEKRTASGLNSAGTDVLASDLAATQSGVNSTTFNGSNNAAIPAQTFLVFAGSALSGTVNQVVVEIDFTIDP